MLEYDSPEWKKKRQQILERDNYTCQNKNCGTFNPSLSEVEIFNEKNNNFELHDYDRNHISNYHKTYPDLIFLYL